LNKEKPKKIKALLGFNRLKDGDLVTRLNAVHDGLKANPAFTTPPVDLPTFKTNIDTFTTDLAAAVDGGKKAITAKNKQRAVVIKMLEHLAHYVEANCKDDLATFTSSGFLPAPTTRTPPQPLPQPSISKAVQGITGQLIITIKALRGAASYELRSAVLGPGNTPGTWTSIHLPSAKATPVNNLTPGTTYTFQARALGRLGFSNWSDPVNRMCT
jgi:hypothetical protein